MKFSNHNPNNSTDNENSEDVEDLQLTSDTDIIKGLKNLEFFLRKPFCGSGRVC